PFAVLALDGVGNLLDWSHQSLDRLACANLVHGAKQLKELQLKLRQETEQSRHHLTLHRIAVKKMTGVQSHLMTDMVLKGTAHKIGHAHLILEGAGLQAHLFLQNSAQQAGNSGNHAISSRGADGIMSASAGHNNGTAPRPGRRPRRAAPASAPGPVRASWC